MRAAHYFVLSIEFSAHFLLLLNPGINSYFVFESCCKMLGDKCYLHWAVYDSVIDGISHIYNIFCDVYLIGTITPAEKN